MLSSVCRGMRFWSALNWWQLILVSLQVIWRHVIAKAPSLPMAAGHMDFSVWISVSSVPPPFGFLLYSASFTFSDYEYNSAKGIISPKKFVLQMTSWGTFNMNKIVYLRGPLDNKGSRILNIWWSAFLNMRKLPNAIQINSQTASLKDFPNPRIKRALIKLKTWIGLPDLYQLIHILMCLGDAKTGKG